MREAKRKHTENEKQKALAIVGYAERIFDKQGGDGFDGRLNPNPDCCECFGYGITRVTNGDSMALDENEAFMFISARQTKYGINVKTISRMWALHQLALHIGFYKCDVHKNQEGIKPIDYKALDMKFEETMKKSKERHEQLMIERKDLFNS